MHRRCQRFASEALHTPSFRSTCQADVRPTAHDNSASSTSTDEAASALRTGATVEIGIRNHDVQNHCAITQSRAKKSGGFRATEEVVSIAQVAVAFVVSVSIGISLLS